MRTKVYISGPITHGSRIYNFTQAERAMRFLMMHEFSVLNPMLSMTVPWEAEMPHEEWLENDYPWVLEADAVLRLPGFSEGADLECALAVENEIPVFTDIQALVETM